MRSWNLRASGALFVCAILCGGLSPAYGHNYVNFDLGWHTPAPLPKDQIRVTINLLDTDSISKSGDLVKFDALVLQVTEEPVAHASSSSFELKSVIKSHTEQFEVSCGWRSLTRLPERDAKGALIYTAMLLPRGLLRGDEEQNIAIDRICSGSPLHAAQGAKSADEAIAFFKPSLYPGTFAITVQRRVQTQSQYPLPWIETDASHRFVPVAVSSANALFVDRAEIARGGDTVTTTALVILAPDNDARHSPFDGSAALATVRFDCASRSMTVLKQVMFDEFGGVLRTSDVAFAPRAASESPVTAAAIASACSNETSAAASYSTIEEAWDHIAVNWPPHTRAPWLPCIWEHFPEAVRADYLNRWQASFAGAAVPYAPSLPKPDAASAAACSNAHPFQALVEAYGIERAALSALASSHVDEPQLKAAFGALPWLEQRQFVAAHFAYGASNPQLDAAVLNAVTARLGIAPSDMTARTAVQRYLEAEAKLDGNLS